MIARGPYFEELAVGQRFPSAGAVTITDGLAAVHQSIVGDRFALALDSELARSVTAGERLAAPSLVWDLSIGQSTIATHHVKANLFYRGLAFHRFPLIGDTLSTTTTVAGLRQNRARAGRAATGLAALRITTVDQHDRPVLDFWRCAMLPLRNGSLVTGQADDLDLIGQDASTVDPTVFRTWSLTPVRKRETWYTAGTLPTGRTVKVIGGDVVSGAPELARLTLNIARVHHDAAAAGGERLVYGGHTIGIAAAQAVRALPGMLVIAGWRSCDHLGPVHENDVLTSRIDVGEVVLSGEIALVELRSRVAAGDDRPVLDWRYTAVFAS